MDTWTWIQVMLSPVYSTCVVPSDYIATIEQQSMVNAAGSYIDSQLKTTATSYYHKSWSVISILTLNGDLKKASQTLNTALYNSTASSPTKKPTAALHLYFPTKMPTAAPNMPSPTNPLVDHPSKAPSVPKG
eukprot:13738753-Ditylum_brightwellii.AAC.1